MQPSRISSGTCIRTTGFGVGQTDSQVPATTSTSPEQKTQLVARENPLFCRRHDNGEKSRRSRIVDSCPDGENTIPESVAGRMFALEQ